MAQPWSCPSVQQLNGFWNRAFGWGCMKGCCPAVPGHIAHLHGHLCATLCCIVLSQFQHQGSVEPSRKQYEWQQSQSRVVTGRGQTFRMRLSCLSYCTAATAELETFVFTQSLKGAREQCCAIKHCVCFLLYVQDFSFITIFCQYPCQCCLPSRFFGKTCKRVDTYNVLSVIFK